MLAMTGGGTVGVVLGIMLCLPNLSTQPGEAWIGKSRYLEVPIVIGAYPSTTHPLP